MNTNKGSWIEDKCSLIKAGNVPKLVIYCGSRSSSWLVTPALYVHKDSGWPRSYNGSAKHFLPALLASDLNICLFPVFQFLGTFANWRKATICFAMCIRQSVYLSVRPHGKTRLPLDGFLWNLILNIFRKHLSRKFKVSLKYDKKKGNFTWRPIYSFDHISLSSSQAENVKKL